MKIDLPSGSILTEDIAGLASRFLASENMNFAEQVEFLQLNPACDLRHADLSFVDFSGADLTGFDFTGANLHGAFGSEVQWDGTTDFSGADTSSSVFAYDVDKRRFFENHPELAERVERLKNEHWANALLTIHDMLRADRGSGEALRIARAVFDESNSSTVRSELLLYMSLGSETKDEHKAFIYSALSAKGQAPALLRSCIRTLRALYVNDRDAFNMMSRFIGHADERVSQEAATGVLSSIHFIGASDEIKDALLSSGSSLTRRSFVGRIAKAEFKQIAEILVDSDVSNFIDFSEPISNEKILRMARRSFSNEKLRGLQAKQLVALLVDRNAPPPSDEDPEVARAKLIKVLMRSLAGKYGIPFRLEADNSFAAKGGDKLEMRSVQQAR